MSEFAKLAHGQAQISEESGAFNHGHVDRPFSYLWPAHKDLSPRAHLSITGSAVSGNSDISGRNIQSSSGKRARLCWGEVVSTCLSLPRRFSNLHLLYRLTCQDSRFEPRTSPMVSKFVGTTNISTALVNKTVLLQLSKCGQLHRLNCSGPPASSLISAELSRADYSRCHTNITKVLASNTSFR